MWVCRIMDSNFKSIDGEYGDDDDNEVTIKISDRGRINHPKANLQIVILSTPNILSGV